MATKKVNIDIIARDKSQQALNKVRGNLDGVKKAVFNVRNALAGLGAGLVIRNLVNTGKEIEGLQVRLKFLFGTAEEGAKAFDRMAEFASRVPFSLQEIQAGSGNLAVVAKDAEELADLLEITGNVAAATGLDFRTTAEQIQRSFSAGIGAADLFRDRGVRAMLGFQAGATVSIDETIKRFEEVFGAGGEFGGTTKALAETLEGTLSMINDSVFNFKRTILDAGFFAELKNQFGDLDDFIKANQTSIDEIAISIGKGLAQAVTTSADAIKFLKDNFDLLVDVIQFLIGIKVAKIFLGMSAAIATANSSMLLFNATIKRNLFIAGAAVVVSQFDKIQTALGKLKGDFDNVSEAIKQNEILIKHYEQELDQARSTLEMFKNSTGITEKQLKVYSDQVDETTKKLKSLRENTTALKNSQNEHLRVQNNVNQTINEETETIKKQTEKVKILKENIGLLDGDFRALNGTLLESKIANEKLIEIYENQEHPMKAITDQLKAEEAQLKKNMKVYKDHAELRKRASTDIFKSEREQAQNNQQKMFDDALENNAKMVELKKQGNQEIFNNTKTSLQALSGLNRTAFEAFKRFQIAEATINAVKAASTAFTTYAGNPFLATAVAASSLAKGMALVAQIKSTNYREKGGPVSQGQAYMVGEKGPEMFVPNQSGNIIANNKLGGQPVNVNFNISTVDASGFNELLTNSRGVIVNMINSAVNETGRQAIV